MHSITEQVHKHVSESCHTTMSVNVFQPITAYRSGCTHRQVEARHDVLEHEGFAHSAIKLLVVFIVESGAKTLNRFK